MWKTVIAVAAGSVLLAGCGSGSISSPSGATSANSASNVPSTQPSNPTGSLASAYKTTVWEDNFANDPAGPLSTSSSDWAEETGNGVAYGNAGWGNNEAEYYLPGNATVGGGTLNLHGHADSSVLNDTCGTSTPGNCMFSSAKVTSLKTVDLSQSGFLEIKAELPTGTGSWPALWLLPGPNPDLSSPPNVNNGQPTWPAGGEIDMVEWLGRYFAGQDSLVQSTLHLPSGTPSPTYTDSFEYQKATLSSPLSTSFHLYQLAWTPGQIEFAVDNQVIMTCTKSTMSCTPTVAGIPSFPASSIWPYGTTAKNYYVIMNLAIGGYLGAPNGDNTQVPANYDQTMQVAYVRYMTP